MSKSTIKGDIKVFFRIFPMEKMSREYLQVKDNNIYIRNLQQLSKRSSKEPPVFWEFITDGVFFNSNQDFVYATIMVDLLDRIIKGYNGIIAAYGQTGTGKSVTVGGLYYSEENFGFLPRLIYDLFIEKRKLPNNIKMSVQMSYVEFSKSAAADLLKEFPNFINIHQIKEISKVKVRTEFEALKLIYIGEGRKTFADRDEYMSHLCPSVVTFYITTLNEDFTYPRKICSRLHIIDMAGVDTAGNRSSNFKHPLDIGKANIFKSDLEQFFLCLMDNIPEYTRVKERMNPLIYYLGDDLSNENILRFIGHIRILKEDLVISLSMLRFGQLVRGLKPKLREIVFEINEEVKAEYFEKQFKQLQQENLLNSILLNQDLTKSLNNDRIQHIHKTAREYLNNHVTEITVLNVAEATEIFKVFKQICSEFEAEKHKIHHDAYHKFQFENNVNMKHKSSANSINSIKANKLLARRQSAKRSKDSSMHVEKLKSIDKASRQSLAAQKIKPEDEASTVKRSEGSHLQISKSKSSFENVRRQQSKTEGPVLKNKVKSSSANIMKRSGSKTSMSQLNKFKSGSVNVVKRSVSKRRSSASTSVTDKRDSKTCIENALMPDVIPDYQEIWNTFVNDNPTYKTLLEYYKDNERRIQYIYPIYMEQVKKLQQCREVVEKIKLETLEIQMAENFNTTNSNEIHKTSNQSDDTKRLGGENLIKAQNELLEQQEAVLRWQSELKISLYNRNEIKKQIHEDFNHYCKNKVYVSVPNLIGDDILMEETTTVNLEKTEVDGTDVMMTIQNAAKRASELELLQKITRKELQKNKKLKEKMKKKWTNYLLK